MEVDVNEQVGERFVWLTLPQGVSLHDAPLRVVVNATITPVREMPGHAQRINGDVDEIGARLNLYRLMPGEWAMSREGHITVFYADKSTARRAVRMNLQLLLPIEETTLACLRGAHLRSKKEIEAAFSALGLGAYGKGSNSLVALETKGHLSIVNGEPHVRNTRREWVRRPALPEVVDPRPDPLMWDGPFPSPANPLWSGTPWWDVVGWPAHRGGRPRVAEGSPVVSR